jgi:hypothetical protein
MIKKAWIKKIIENPVDEMVQEGGRIRLWGVVDEMGGRYLRFILLDDGETVHNAFFDRGFKR